MVVVVARIKAAEGHSEELAAKFQDMVAWVRDNEDGTLTYACNRSSDDPNSFLFFERYTDQAALDAHMGSERFAQLVTELQGKLDGGVEMDTYEELATKI